MSDAPPRVVGAIGMIAREFVRGWAGLAGRGEPVEIAIRINGIETARLMAADARPEMQRRGLHPTGRCGFLYRFPADKPIQDGDVVSVMVVGPDLELPNSPMRCSLLVADGTTTAVPDQMTAERPSAEVRARPVVNPIEVPKFPRPPHRGTGRVFLDSLTAFFLREIRSRFGKSRMGYLWGILQPGVYMLMFSTARGAVNGGNTQVSGVDHIFYLQIAMIPFFMFSHGFNQAVGATKQFAGLFNYRQVAPLDLLIVRVFIEFLTMGLVFILFTLGLSWLGFTVELNDWPAWLLVVFFIFLFTLGLVMLAEVAIAYNPDLRVFVNMVERPLLLFSGVFFGIKDLPPTLREYLLWNPLLHATDLARGAMLSNYEVQGSWQYFTGVTLFVLIAGLGAYRKQQSAIMAS